MKQFLFTLALGLGLTLGGCSTCYECYQDIPLIDANTGDTISTTRDTDEFCTADFEEVTDREDEGASCQRI